MALKAVAVSNVAFTLSHGAGSTCSGGSFTVTSPASLFAKIDGDGIFTGTLTFTWTGTFSGQAAGGAGTVSATATYSAVDGFAVLRVDDTGTMTGAQIATPLAPFASQPVKISAAGQSSVLAE